MMRSQVRHRALPHDPAWVRLPVASFRAALAMACALILRAFHACLCLALMLWVALTSTGYGESAVCRG